MIAYAQAKAAFEAGGKFYREGTVWIVTRVLRPDKEGDVFWVTDADSLGEVGALLYPDGWVEKRHPPVTSSSV